MKNLSLGVKLGIGFAVILCISCLLGGMAIWKMKEQDQGSTLISEVFVPEVNFAVQYERATRVLREAVLNFTNTGDEQYYRKSEEQLDEMERLSGEVDKLVAAFPFLTSLAERNAEIRRNVGAYRALVEKMRGSVTHVDELRVQLRQAGNALISSVEKVLQSSGNLLDSDMRGSFVASDAAARMRNIRHGYETLTLAYRIRLENNRMQALRDVRSGEQVGELFKPLLAGLNEFKSQVKAENAGLAATAIEAAERYHDAFEKMLADWRELEALLKPAESVGDVVLKNATLSAVGGFEDVKARCLVNSEIAHGAISLLSGGLIVAVLIGGLLSWTLARLITGPLRKSVDFAGMVAAGNLDRTLDICQKDEVGRLADALNSMVGTLSQRIRDAAAATEEAQRRQAEATRAMSEAEKARKEAEQAKRQGMLDAAARLESVVAGVSKASEELANQVRQASLGAQEQAARISETATAMEEMNSTVLEVARNAGTTAEASNQARDKAAAGSSEVQKVVAGMATINSGAEELRAEMEDLSRKAESIGAILNVISDIADQTNLLALNAAIEAARAGEAGRGFAVVADEVRKLAEKTMQATAQVGQAIRGIQDGTAKNMAKVENTVRMVDDVTALANNSGMALSEIVSLVDSESDQIRAIATASEEQSATSEEINRSIEEVSRIASETASAMQASDEVVLNLGQQAQELDNLIREMKSN